MERRQGKGLSIDRQLFLAFLVIGINMSLVSWLGWWVNQRLANRLQATEALWEINEGQTQIQASERSLLALSWSLERRAQEQERIKSAWVQINNGFKLYKTISATSDVRRLGLTPEEQKLYEGFIQDWDSWVATHQDFMKLANEYESVRVDLSKKTLLELANETGQTRNARTVQASTRAAYDKLNEMAVQTATQKAPAFQKATNSLLAVLEANEDHAGRLVAWSRLLLLAVMLISPVVAIALAVYFVQTIAYPLTRLLQRVQNAGSQVNGSVSEIAASSRQLEATLTEQAASTREVMATAQQISRTSQDLAKTMESVTQLANATASAAETSRTEMEAMEQTMRQLTKATETIAAKLGTISDRSHRINTIVTTITKVADQTNLLSLNASIEAEKAGEYGRGFAVVAREIRRLADQTAVATLDIESMVREMQSSVATGVMEVDKFSVDVTQSAQAINATGRQLGSLIEKVASLAPQFGVVDRGMSDQANNATEISEAMTQLSDATSLNADALREVNQSLQELGVVAQELQHEASKVNV